MNDNDLSKLETFNKYNKNIEFICDDAKNIIEKYKNNDRVFMFIDPPYLLNNVYNTKHIADYTLNFIKDLNNCNCKKHRNKNKGRMCYLLKNKYNRIIYLLSFYLYA